MAPAQTTSSSSGSILEELQRLRETGRVLYLAAHPDDENTRLIAYLANGRHYATGYLSLTRGDGGQNLIGPELRDALGVIRTQELLAARRIDGGRQFFSRANDFGYSKSAEEALTVWDREAVLSDVVRVIRQFRPDVIVTRFSPTRGGTHGHHTGSAVLAVQAFPLANDSSAFADELGHLEPWQPQRVVWNAWSRVGSSWPDALELDVGGYNAVRGESFGEIAARSRSEHRSQGFGAIGTRGSAPEQFVHLAGELASNDLMDGVSDRWAERDGGQAVAVQLDAIIAAFDPRRPGQSVPALLAVRQALAEWGADDDFVDEKQTQLDQIVFACLGLYAEATVSNAQVAPGETLELSHRVVQREVASVQVIWQSIGYLADEGHADVDRTLRVNRNESVSATRSLPVNTALTHPYWLELPSTAGMAQVADKSLIGTPENQPAYPVRYDFLIGGQEFSMTVAPEEVIRDRVRGELRDTLRVIPPVAVSFVRDLERFAPGETRIVTVRASAARPALGGAIILDAPAGWAVSPSEQSFALAETGDDVEANFSVTAPQRTESVKLTVSATVGGRQFNRTPQVVAYDHIPVQMLQPPATLTAMSFDLKIEGRQVGFIAGAGDTTVEALTLMGYQVKVLADSDLTADGLAGLDAVVLGIRAFNTRPELMGYRDVLWDFVRGGGNVVVQYNTTGGLPDGDLGPYPFRLSRDRVTDETAKVTLLDREHPAMLRPNRISSADFEGWVQERGLYFPNSWDPAYTPLLSMADLGEEPTQGSLLVAPLGEGYFVYTGLSFFRELPAGVPGAYRLLANLISL
ncbi:MAG: PIG-L family deacetylase [Synoicihabitans sp.]